MATPCSGRPFEPFFLMGVCSFAPSHNRFGRGAGPTANKANSGSRSSAAQYRRCIAIAGDPNGPAERFDRPLPINLATALCLSQARPLIIASAQASVEKAAAQLQGAQALWLPDLHFGADYSHHDGANQGTDGNVEFASFGSFYAGGGATLDFGVTDAIFHPLAARQELFARQ